MRMNKRGISQLTDIVMSLILFTVFFALIMIMAGSRLLTVHATIEAANTALICQNDINAVMEFPADGKKIKDVLVENYQVENYTTFETEISRYLNDYATREGNWKITLLQEEPDLEEPSILYEFSEIINKKNSQMCNYFVPLPCDDEVIELCTMEVQLELSNE